MNATSHPLYRTWGNMRQRCNNPNYPTYKYYGARGIRICQRWDNFWLFVEDMGEKPTSQHSLDRIDNNKGYEPGNCKWSTKSEQVLNRNMQSNNTSGAVGVSWDKSRKKWMAHAKRNGKFINLGRFNNKEDAVAARGVFS